MTLSEISIRRPVLATVLTLVIIIFGVVGYMSLPVREYPSVDTPIITVRTTYTGANAEVIENQITEPIEQQVNGVSGIRSIRSMSRQGMSYIFVEFELDVDLETAANDVRDKVSAAQRYLPRDCDPPTVTKADSDASPILQINVYSPTRSLLELSEIADLSVKERLQSVKDVSSAMIWGEKRYAMRLWLDPVKMAGLGITPLDIKQAIDKENIELPSGNIEGEATQLMIRVKGYMSTPEEFDNIIIKKDDKGVVRLSDVARAELAPEDIRSFMKQDGVPMVSVMLVPQPGANQVEIADEVYKRLDELRKDIPSDVQITIAYDNTKFVRASIAEVQETLYVAFALVVLIIFLFLRDWRVTLVPIVVIPVSLVGSFFVMYIAGFSLNVLTLLAVVLAVGLVVDDAIVVTENIYGKIEEGMTPVEAGIEGSKEIFFAVISTTITLAAVFLPIIFMSGMTGKLFIEFSIVISSAVIISAFVALTFTPMIATKLLKQQKQHSLIYRKTEPFFLGLNNLYERSLGVVMKRRWTAIAVMALTFGAIYLLWERIPSETAPLEDRSLITVNTKTAEGSTYEFNRDYVEELAEMVDSVVPEGTRINPRVSSSSSYVRVLLPDIKDREESQMEIAQRISANIGRYTKGRAFVQQQSTFGGQRATMPIQYVLQATNIEKLQEFLPKFLERASQSKILVQVDSDLKFTYPELYVNVNREKANLLDVNTQDIGQTLQYALSGQRMGYFYMNGKQYQIIAEINRQQRNKPLDLTSLYVRNSAGKMIQIDNVVSLEEGVRPPTLYRYNRFISATISAGLAEGRTIGEGLDEMDRIAAETLDETFRTALSGESKDFRDSSSSLMFAMIFALVLIFLVLSAQFESFKDPMIIMFTVPLAVAGALLFMYLEGQTMNIFSQIGIIMLIGLVTKNGILIVEFANQRQAAGIPKAEAIKGAAVQRLRPILMTSLSTILGALPLMFAAGEGANGRIAMGTAVVGGLLLSMFLTLYIVPVMYSYFSTDKSRIASLKTLSAEK